MQALNVFTGWKSIVLSLLLISLWGFTMPNVFATLTPTRCDSPFSKYGCTRVNWTDIGNNQVTINDRQWQGAIDGGAKKWQSFYIRDWQWVNGSMQLVESWGESGWRNDVLLSPWFSWSNDNRTRIRDTYVQFTFRYEETTDHTYKWCSPKYEHSLLNNTSIEVFPAVC